MLLGGRSLGRARHWQPGGQDVEDAVQHLAHVHRALAAAALGRRDEGLDQRPFPVGQVARVAQARTIVESAAVPRSTSGISSMPDINRQTPAGVHQPPGQALTTNYDLIVEKSYKLVTSPPLQSIVKTLKDGDLFETRLGNVTSPVGLYKLHGCIDEYSDNFIPLILGQGNMRHISKIAIGYTKSSGPSQQHPLIFCGYSISDAHIQQILFDLTDHNVKRPMYYHISPGTDEHWDSLLG